MAATVTRIGSHPVPDLSISTIQSNKYLYNINMVRVQGEQHLVIAGAVEKEDGATEDAVDEGEGSVQAGVLLVRGERAGQEAAEQIFSADKS